MGEGKGRSGRPPMTIVQRSAVRARLQKEYDRCGSIRAYAAAEGITYSTAWDRLNRYGVTTRRTPGRPAATAENRAKLEEAYAAAGRSVATLAANLGITVSAAYNRLYRLGIVGRKGAKP